MGCCSYQPASSTGVLRGWIAGAYVLEIYSSAAIKLAILFFSCKIRMNCRITNKQSLRTGVVDIALDVAEICAVTSGSSSGFGWQ